MCQCVGASSNEDIIFIYLTFESGSGESDCKSQRSVSLVAANVTDAMMIGRHPILTNMCATSQES